MTRKIILSLYVLTVGCQGQTRVDNQIEADSTEYPLLVDNGQRIIYHPGGDTVVFTKGQLYQNDSSRHPLQQFRLSYPEWKTIKCIISVDERGYEDKAMIALIEKTGDLRINYKAKTIRLTPAVPVKLDQGQLTGTFKSDSLEVQISGQLDRRSSESLRGQGNLIFRTPTKTINEAIFLVYELK